MQTIALGTCLFILITAAPASAQVPDIRGLTYEAYVNLWLEGVVLEETLKLQTEMDALGTTPHSFDILPDEHAPMDPTRIVIRTRLPVGPDDPGEVRFELHGLYDPITGKIEAAGIAQGLHFWQTPFATDAFGNLDAPASVWLQVTDPQMTLYAVVPPDITDTTLMGFEIVGGDALGPYHVAAALEMNAQRVAWLPFGTSFVGDANFGPYGIEDVTAFYDTLFAQVNDVFGDVDNDMLLTQSDVIKIHKMFGPIPDGDYEGDLTADGLIDVQDADLLQWLVRCIGCDDYKVGPVLQGTTGNDGKASKTSPKLGTP
jgi:hypothetical protein